MVSRKKPAQSAGLNVPPEKSTVVLTGPDLLALYALCVVLGANSGISIAGSVVILLVVSLLLLVAVYRSRP